MISRLATAMAIPVRATTIMTIQCAASMTLLSSELTGLAAPAKDISLLSFIKPSGLTAIKTPSAKGSSLKEKKTLSTDKANT